ncbi:unnamed protein product [Ambrosiozyma monospora]|uniref:Unnamed protein product n=1 Tax=Ambrosiozyma monospora TaxID=43982 RepID=A0ACB5T6M0_AMBMO|nr:unnamed protein product [Ambrosiozyma monospora]
MNPAAKTVPAQVPTSTSKMKRIDLIDQELSPTPDLPPLSPPNSPPCSPDLSPRSTNINNNKIRMNYNRERNRSTTSTTSDYAISSDSEIWSLNSDRDNYYPSSNHNQINNNNNRRNHRYSRSVSSGSGSYDEDEFPSESSQTSFPSSPIESFVMSSDSYFSHQRDSFSEIRGRKLDIARGANNSSQNHRRRVSDTSSMRSNQDDPCGGLYITESDQDLLRSQQRQQQTLGFVYSNGSSASLSATGSPQLGPTSRRSSYSSYGSGSGRGSPNTPPRRRRSSARSRDGSESVNGSSEISETAKIFKNLLIMEESLRQQSRHQSNLIKKYTIFVFCLFSVMVFSAYRLLNNSNLESNDFSDPTSSTSSNDSTNNNSPSSTHTATNSYMTLLYQVCFTISLLTLILFYLNGDYNRTIGRPRRFLNTTNKGIRQLNIRLVRVKIKLIDRCLDTLKFSLLFPTRLLKFQCRLILKLVRFEFIVVLMNWLIEFEVKLNMSRCCVVGVHDVKLVLNPRVFSTATREHWELYRNEFWNKETMRRRRVLLKEKDSF